ncbi:GNAT family N-acetyltransferase [Olleya sp. ITB9]|uniref:GNAT family N-acetyltransferase n=1 Tax=Olleya sp. ITB9 TaxID=1715648 RepID=UPI0006D218C6|nr:GNAT family N-acetyltransferase [Olleya sp. ITB9]
MIDFKIHDSVLDLPDTWNTLVTHDIFLQTPFLNALEVSCPKNIKTHYISIFDNQKQVGLAVVQRVKIYIDDVFRNPTDNALKRFIKTVIAQVVKGNALIVGNLIHTGQHGLFFDQNYISQTNFLTTVFNAINTLALTIKKEEGKTIRIIGFKDYFTTDSIHLNTSLFTKNQLYKLQVQPSMVLSLKQEWSSIDDYVISLKKKYRSRYRTALKKANTIVKKELDLGAIVSESEQLFTLYKYVSDNAKVNSFVLDQQHFFNLKKHLDQDFKVFGYYLDGKLIGFYTLIINNSDLETYFLGYNPKYQHKHQLYLNMLYDMLAFGIDNNLKQVVYARTALEIKSSVGAKPEVMYIYMKHTNTVFINPVLRYIVKTLNPVKKWEQRHPFK